MKFSNDICQNGHYDIIMTVRMLNRIHVLTVFKKITIMMSLLLIIRVKSCSLLKVLINHAFFSMFIKAGTLVSMDLAGMLIPHRLGNSLR